jgi:hypothetical protein
LEDSAKVGPLAIPPWQFDYRLGRTLPCCFGMTPEQRAQITYRNERWRSVCAGVLETAGNTFMLLLAVRYFQAGAMTKALVAGGGSCGLLLSPLVVNVTQRLGWPATVAGSRILFIGALACLIAAFSPLSATWLYAGACVLSLTLSLIHI